MITFSIVKDWFVKKGFKVLKVQEFGAKTAEQASDFGEDSTPLKDMVALYANTSEDGDNVIIGYLNKQHLTAEGEKRIFSLRPDGSLSIDIHLKNDGTLQVGGDAHTAVRFAPLNTAIQQQIAQAINTELTKIQTGITAAGGTYTPQPLNVDLSGAESPNIKLQ